MNSVKYLSIMFTNSAKGVKSKVYVLVFAKGGKSEVYGLVVDKGVNSEVYDLVVYKT